jgi:energy-coupling factor transporter ATP-binding protein EcfA2
VEEGVISARMRLGDLLVGANLATSECVAKALRQQAVNGKRLGDNLVLMGAIEQQTLDAFLKRIPAEPANMAATGLDEIDLLSLLTRLIYSGHLETCRQYVDAIRLPYHIVADLVAMAIDRKLLRTLGMRSFESENPIDMSYAFTDEGKRWTLDAMERVSYAGPAPVTLGEFTYQVSVQKLTNERVSFERIRAALGELTFDDSIVEQCGPALNAARAMLLYGPSGNGKSSLAHALGSVFSDVIYMPYAIIVEGQIIRFHDPSVHVEVSPTELSDESEISFVRAEEYDARWVPCRRPFVTAGGELTLDMLDLRYDAAGHFYEAPLHLKALGGCFVIDDFGRQQASPVSVLNRWIVPLESRVDYLKLHTGKSFVIPFEEMVIFSTNLEPESLMDPAFLRRLPYKIEVEAPSVDNYRRIFDKESARQGLTLPEEAFNAIVQRLRKDKGMELAAYQPKFIVDQVVAACRFVGEAPHFEPRYIEYALKNLRVRKNANP